VLQLAGVLSASQQTCCRLLTDASHSAMIPELHFFILHATLLIIMTPPNRQSRPIIGDYCKQNLAEHFVAVRCIYTPIPGMSG
jgi:hypothetical protein